MPGTLKLFCLIFLVSLGTAFGQDDPSPSISKTIASGNAKTLSRYFNEMIDLNIPGFKGNCSKTQSERIIQAFFTKYPVRSFSVSRKGRSPDGSKFIMGSLDSGNKKYSLYYLYRITNNGYLVFQFQMQEETTDEH
jgi:hypothetical protein